MQGIAGTPSKGGASEGTDGGWPLDGAGWPDWPLGDDDDAAWLTIAPGVEAHADTLVGSRGHSAAGSDADAGQSHPHPASGGVHRASGDSMATAGRQTADGRLDDPGPRPGPTRLGSSRQGRARREDGFGRRVRGRMLAGLALVLAVAVVVVVVVRVVASGALSPGAADVGGAVARVDAWPQASADPAAPTTETSTTDTSTDAGAGGLAVDPAPRPSEASGTAEPAARQSDPPGSADASEQPDWWNVLAQLDARRSDALARLDLSLVPGYAAADSDVWRADVALIGRLLGDRMRPRGLSTTVVSVESVEAVDGAAERDDAEAHLPSAVSLTVVDERSAYELVGDDGAVVRTVAKSGTRRWRLTLVPLGGASSGSSGGESTADPSAGTAEGRADARSAVADDAPVAETPGGAPDQPAPGARPQVSESDGDVDPGWRISDVEPVS